MAQNIGLPNDFRPCEEAQEINLTLSNTTRRASQPDLVYNAKRDEFFLVYVEEVHFAM